MHSLAAILRRAVRTLLSEVDRPMQFLAIIGFCILSAVLYGILHDQVTARVCVEYFTVGHPPVFDTESPTLLGIGWGITATWWVGFLLGVPLAVAARAGGWPKRDVGSLVRPVGTLLGVMAVCALVAGCVGYVLARRGILELAPVLAVSIPPERHARFLADGAAHLMSYGVGFMGGLVVIARMWISRRNEAKATRETSASGSESAL